MIDESNSSSGACTPWWQHAIPLFSLTWAAYILVGFTLIFVPSQSLHDSFLEVVFFGLLFSLFFGSLGFLMWVALPLLLFLALTHKWLRCRPWIVGAFLLGGTAYICFHQFGPSSEKRRFEVLTHMRWDSADCLMAKRAEVMGDGSLYFWAFRGSPSQFKEHLSQLPWEDQPDRRMYFDDANSSASKRANEAFGSDWRPTKMYHYANDRRDSSPPFGISVMAVDEAQQCWAIFWISQ